MKVRVVWLGLAALSSATFGFSLSQRARTSAEAGALVLALSAVLAAIVAAEVGRRFIGIASGRRQTEPEAERLPVAMRNSVLFFSGELVLFALVFPLVGFLAAGRTFAGYPWSVSGALAVIAGPLTAATPAGLPERGDRPSTNRVYRARALAAVLSSFAGVVLMGVLSPGAVEARLLGLSPAVVVSVLGMTGCLHPSPEGSWRLTGIVVPLSFLSATFGLAGIRFFS